MIGNRSDHLDRIKERLSVSEALSHYGVKATSGRGKALCPCHEEKTPSLSYDDGRGVWNCFGCGRGGDVIRLIEEKQGLGFREALRIAAGWTGIPIPEHDPVRMEKERAVHTTLSIVANQAHELLNGPKGTAALEYLHGRGIEDSTIERFMLGYYPAEGLGITLSKAELEAAGLIGEKGGELFKGYIIFPHYHLGVVEYLTGRRPDGRKPKSMKPLSDDGKLKMTRPYLAGDAMAAEPTTLLVNEGELNALSMWQAERPAVATCGSKGLGERLKEWLTTAQGRGKVVHLCYDPDEAGAAALKKYGGACAGLRVVTMPKGKDANDLLQDDPKGFSATIDRLVAESHLWLEKQAEKTKGDSVALTELLEVIALWDPATPTERTNTFSLIAEKGEHKIGDLRQEFAEILRRPESSPVKVLSRIKSPDGYFLEVEYTSPSGDRLTLIKPREMFLDSRNISKLAGEGFPVSTVSAKERIAQVESLEKGPAVKDELGHLRAGSWLPDRRGFALSEVIGEAESRYIGEPAHLAALSPSGSVDDCKALLRVYLPKHPLIPFICAYSLASPMLALDLARMFIFHLYGETRSGKTAVEKLAASMYGDPRAIIHSSGTVLSLSEYLGTYPNLFTAFDDIAKNFRGKEWRSELNKFIFTATDGQGRLRAKEAGGLHASLSWHCAIMSTAEESLITEDNIGGIGTRVIQYHVREPILSSEEASELHRQMDGEGHLCGHAARAFIPYYLEHRDPDAISQLKNLIERRIALPSLRRVAPTMAAVAYAMGWLQKWAQADEADPLDIIDRIIERASEDEQEPYWERGLRAIYEFTETYKHHFEEADAVTQPTTLKSPIYGRRDGDIFHIHEKPLREWLIRAGDYDLARLRKELAARGYIDKKGSITARLSTTKSFLKCIVFNRKKATSSPAEIN